MPSAIHLQDAINVMTGAAIPRTEAEVEAVLDSPEGRALQERLGWSGNGGGSGE